MVFYPVNLHMEGKRCIVVGGGNVAERKVNALLEAAADVTVVSPHLTPGLSRLAQEQRIIHINRPYRQGDLAGFFLAICATDSAEMNRLAASEANAGNILVNVIDAPELGSFQVPAQLRRGELLLTVSTGGKSPALARQLRRELAERYGEEYALYIDMVARLRDEIKLQLNTANDREVFWRQTMNEDLLALLRQGRLKEAEARIRHAAGSFGTQS